MYFLIEILDRGRFGMTSIRQWEFWRNCMVYFCIYSLVGHWMEIPYCLFNKEVFGIVPDDSLVFSDPLNPFMVYGVGVVLCAIFLVPFKDYCLRKFNSGMKSALAFFAIAVLMAMAMELIMGFIFNQPDATGEFPLWNNAILPGNILGQAWIVNDLLLGAVATLFTWAAYPASERFFLSYCTPRGANIRAFLCIAAFIVLCIVEFGIKGVGNIY